MNLKGKRVFVTGGSGFVGGRLVETLVVDQQAQVCALVHRTYSGALRMARFNVKFAHGDITDTEAMRQATVGCDVIFHLASGRSGTVEEQTRVTVEGTRAMAQAAMANKVSRFVNLSSASVYLGGRDGVVDETSPRRRWGWAYSDAKMAAEDVVRDHCCKDGLPGTILQVAGVYGPWGETFSIQPLLQLRRGRVVLVNGGDGFSNATYLDDVVQALLLGAVRPAAVGETFLIKGPGRVTYQDLYRCYESMLGVKATVAMTASEIRREQRRLRRQTLRRPVSEPGPGGIDDARPLILPDDFMIPYYKAKVEFSTRKAEQMLGFAPRYDLHSGMRLTEAWARWARLLPPMVP